MLIQAVRTEVSSALALALALALARGGRAGLTLVDAVFGEEVAGKFRDHDCSGQVSSVSNIRAEASSPAIMI